MSTYQPFTWLPRFRFSAAPDLIKRTDGGEYLWRWKVARWLGFEAKFHVFRESDPDDVHDHPWSFVSVLLAGSYVETRELADGTLTTKRRTAPSIAWRSAECRHSVQVPDGPALTLVISGPRRRRWGFWITCWGERTWIPWRKYNGGHRC